MQSTRRPLLGVLLGVLLTGCPGSLTAQTVEGRVIDVDTGAPVPGVALVLISDTDVVAARAESDGEGNFVLAGRGAGDHRIEAERLGFEPLVTELFRLEREVLEIELLISRAPIELDPVTVVSRRHDPRHDATFEGALMRKERLPDVGPRRVILRDEPEMRASDRVSDVLQGFPRQSGCVILYQEGNMVEDPGDVQELWLDSPSEFWEAVEYYRAWEDAPLGLQGVPNYVTIPMGCTVVALWGRLEGIENERPVWKRALQLGGVLVGFYLIRSLVMD